MPNIGDEFWLGGPEIGEYELGRTHKVQRVIYSGNSKETPPVVYVQGIACTDAHQYTQDANPEFWKKLGWDLIFDD